MHPMVRVVIVCAALAGVFVAGRATWLKVAGNLAAMRSWRRTEAWVYYQGYPAQFVIGKDNEERDEARNRHEYRTANVDHLLGLSTAGAVPMFQDPADPTRVMPAGFLQMWLFPAAMSGWIVVLLAAAVYLALAAPKTGAPLLPVDGITLQYPSGIWKVPLFWSLLGVGLLAGSCFGQDGSRIGRYSGSIVGAAFALMAWGVAARDLTLKLLANQDGVHVTSIVESRYVPWEGIRGIEAQQIYFSHRHGMQWDLPSAGGSLRVYAFVDERGRTLLSFSRELVPKEAMTQLFQLCEARTGAHFKHKDIPIGY